MPKSIQPKAVADNTMVRKNVVNPLQPKKKLSVDKGGLYNPSAPSHTTSTDSQGNYKNFYNKK